jgi:hypothetical protein
MTTITIPSFNLRGLTNLLKYEPAVTFYAANAAAAIGVLWGFHLTVDQTGALSVITTAVASMIIAIMSSPVAVPIIKGAILTVFVALEAFHFQASPTIVGGTVAVVSLILGMLFRQSQTPLPNMPAVPAAPSPGVIS